MTFNETQLNEAKKRISELFIDKFYEFIDDLKTTNGTGNEFGRKYGIQLRQEFVEKRSKANLSNVSWFTSNIFNGGTIDFWTRNGFEKEMIWTLVRDGFLAEDTPWKSGSKTFYFIRQETAKDIFRTYKR